MIEIMIEKILKTNSDAFPLEEDLIYECIEKNFRSEEEVVLDFANIKFLTTAFLNNTIGKLYLKYDRKQIGKYLKIKNISNDDVNLLRLVLLNAIRTAEKNSGAV